MDVCLYDHAHPPTDLPPARAPITESLMEEARARLDALGFAELQFGVSQ